MPLLNREEHPPGASSVAGLKPGDDVFVLAHTGDVMKSYAEFADRKHQHSLPQWQDKYYCKSGLSYTDALAYEKHAEQQLRKQFPKELEGQAVRLIHHSTLRKDDLVSRLHEAIKAAQSGDAGQHKAAVPDQAQAPPAAAAAAAAQQQPDAAAKSSGGVTKKLCQHFLLYAADKQKPGVWVCKEPWVRKYGLKQELPDDLRPPTAPSSPTPNGAAAGTREGTPMKSPDKGLSRFAAAEQPPRTLEDEEARLKPGTLKAAAFGVLKARGVSAPVSADDIVRITTTDGSKIDWTDASKRTLLSVLSQDGTFIRVARGLYTLACWAADVPKVQQQLEQERGAAAAAAGASGGVKDAAADARDAEALEGLPPLARAEHQLAQAQRALAARQKEAAAADEVLAVCEKRLAEVKADAARAKQASPAAKANGSAGGAGLGAAAAAGVPSPIKEELDAKFKLPAHLHEYTGADDDRKAKMAWRQEKAAAEKKLLKERAAHVQQLRLDAAKAAKASTEQLAASVARAKKAAEEVAVKLGRALKAEGDARRAVEREKQREMLKDIKERSKADKEKQKQAEKELREKRRQEALAAKRYPIDDLEHLCEELTAAAAAQMGVRLDADAAQQQGHAASSSAAAAAAVAAAAPAGAAAGNQADVQLPLLPPEQLDLTCITSAEPLAPAEALGLSRALYVSDTLTQFAKPLGVKGCSLAELNALLEAAAAAAAVGGAIGDDTGSKAAREALQWLACTYCRLLKVLLRDVTDVEGAARIYSRWEDALDSSPGAWPELVRRWVRTQDQEGLASPEARAAAEFLRTHDAAGLRSGQHLALLTQLLDDVLDTDLVRDLLAHRLEEAQEAAAGLREQLTDARRKLREAQDEEKELKKKKRAAALALATAAAERQLRELGQLQSTASGDAAAAAAAADANGAAAADDEDGAGAAAAEADAAAGGGEEGGAAAGGKDKEKEEEKRIKAARKEILERAGLSKDKVILAQLEAELAGEAEVEPSWELPAALQEYSGPAGDKKAMSEFRRKQQDERKRLDKARAKWHAEASKRAKERAEAKKKELEQEKELARERTKAEEEVTELQEKFELQEGRYAVRRVPLGWDRFNRSYWWGLGGCKDALLVQQEGGEAAATLELLQAAALGAAAAAGAPPSAATLMASTFAGGHGSSKAPEGERDTRHQHDEEDGDARRDAADSSGITAAAVLSAPLEHAGLLLPRGAEEWLQLDSADVLESLLECCEVKGVREKELKANLEKMLPTMSAAMAKAAAAKAAVAAAAAAAADAPEGAGGKPAGKGGKQKQEQQHEAVAPRALPSRNARSAAAEQIRKTGTISAKAKEEGVAAAAMAEVAAATLDDDDSGPFCGWQLAAVKSAIASLAQVTQPATAAKVAVPPPTATWPQYTKQLQGLVHGEVPDTWQAATTAAAIELLTGRPQAGGASSSAAAAAAATAEHLRDAAWARAIGAAGATPAAAHGDEDAAARHAALSQLRLQLLLLEQQLVSATGEGRYLRSDAELPGSEDADEEESEGEAAHADAMQLDEPPQQQQLPPPPLPAGKGGKGGKAAARGLKRAGSSSADTAAAEAPGAVQDGPTSKRRKGGAGGAAAADSAAGSPDAVPAARTGAAGGLPPRPAPRGRARSSAGGGAASAAGPDAADGASREGSVAPANSGAPSAAAAAAAGKRGKRGRAPAAAAAAAGESAEEPEDEAHAAGRGGKQARGKAACGARGGTVAAAAATDSADMEGSEGRCGSEELQTKGRRLTHLSRALHAQGEHDVDPGEEVADEEEAGHLPARLQATAIWRSPEERASWRACVAAAGTAAALAYCAAALAFHAQQPLQVLASRTKGGAGKGKEAKEVQAPQQQGAQAGGGKGGRTRGGK